MRSAIVAGRAALRKAGSPQRKAVQQLCPSCILATTSAHESSARSFSSSVRNRDTVRLRTFTKTLNQLLVEQRNINTPSQDQVTVKGWIKRIRRHGKISFVDISDGTLLGGQLLQVVLKGSLKDAVDQTWTVGAAVEIQGQLKLVKDKGFFELEAKETRLLALCDSSTYPLQTSPSIDTIRRAAHLRFRRERDAAVLRARDRIEHGIAAWFKEQDFVQVTAPVITGSDCEGAGEVFQICADADVRRSSKQQQQQQLSQFWSGSPAYLTVSSQLHLEALSLALSRVWTYTPSFRAEHSATNRHLAEFRMCEAEIAFVDQLDEVLDCVQGIVVAAIRAAVSSSSDAKQNHPDIALLFGGGAEDASLLSSLRSWAESGRAWPRISYTEAVEQLQQHFPAETAPTWGASLSSEHERWLASTIGQGPLFVTDYPAKIKPFYMRVNSSDKDDVGADDRLTVACFDLLIPGLGELAGGSLREERRDMLEARLDRTGISPESRERLRWYTDDLRRYGGVGHGGFGLGMERLVSWITATENVRDCVPFPRTQGPVRF